MICPADNVLIGLSGGADSVCLTHILSKIRDNISIKLSAIYINHNIRDRETTLAEERFVKSFCADLNIDCKIENIHVLAYASKKHMSVEEAGRILRYEVFGAYGCDKIALAHHADDVAETVLLNLFRGTGIKGTAGIPPVHEVNGRPFIRPLHSLYRSDIESYLSENNLTYCTDMSNLGNDYTRNRIRNSIIPLAKDCVCSGANKNVYAYARRMRLLAGYIENQCADFFERYVIKDDRGYLIGDILYKETHEALRSEVILYTIYKMMPHMKNISEKHIYDVLSLYLKGRGKYICLPKGLRALRVTGGVLLYAEAPTA